VIWRRKGKIKGSGFKLFVRERVFASQREGGVGNLKTKAENLGLFLPTDFSNFPCPPNQGLGPGVRSR
jgi:hypothetical protein